MTNQAIRCIGTSGRTTTYKVADDKVEGGEAAVIAVDEDLFDGPVVNCVTCSAYKCSHAFAVRRFVADKYGRTV